MPILSVQNLVCQAELLQVALNSKARNYAKEFGMLLLKPLVGQ